MLDGNVVGARGVMPNIQHSIGGLSFVTKYEGLVYGDTYDVYCAQNGLLSPKYTYWHGSIVFPTHVQQVSRNKNVKDNFCGRRFSKMYSFTRALNNSIIERNHGWRQDRYSRRSSTTVKRLW